MRGRSPRPVDPLGSGALSFWMARDTHPNLLAAVAAVNVRASKGAANTPLVGRLMLRASRVRCQEGSGGLARRRGGAQTLGCNPSNRGGDDAQYDVGASHNARSSGNVAFYRDALRMLPHFGDIVCELHPQKMIHVGAERLRKLPKSLVTKSPELHLGLSFVSMYGCTVRVSNSLNESETLLCAFRGSSPLIAPREDWPSRPSRHSPSPGYATHLPLVTSQSPLAPCSNYQTRNNLTTTPHGATLQLGRAICRQVSQRLTKSGGCPHVASPIPSPHVAFPRRQSGQRSKVAGLLDSGIAQTTGKHEALKATQTHLA